MNAFTYPLFLHTVWVKIRMHESVGKAVIWWGKHDLGTHFGPRLQLCARVKPFNKVGTSKKP